MSHGILLENLLDHVKVDYPEKQQIPDELTSRLNFIVPKILGPALDLVDHRSVIRLLSPSGRTAYKVTGRSGTVYMCFGHSNYCSCQSFKYSVLKKNENATCKHILAIRLSEAMNVVKESTVTDDQLKTVLLTIE